jgi:thiol-disulfide isomerase/thioredoxin
MSLAKRSFLYLLISLSLGACSNGEIANTGGIKSYLGQDKWLIVNYWASWCGPCREEIPELNHFAKQHSNIILLAVNYDGLTGEQLKAAVADMGIEFTSLATDPAPELGIARPNVLPTTLIIDSTGKVLATLIGPQTEQSLAAAIDQTEGESPKP